uniref:Complement component 8 alpha subunit n=1 Tax=Mus musculus TaxID=10090 RepID=Q8CHK0_MOUSE|nr:complement component 8 alpha subunit [Mus musculus]
MFVVAFFGLSLVAWHPGVTAQEKVNHTDTGASCSQASLEEPSAVVISGMRPAVTAPHLV